MVTVQRVLAVQQLSAPYYRKVSMANNYCLVVLPTVAFIYSDALATIA